MTVNPTEARYIAGAVSSFPELRRLIAETTDPVLNQAYRARLANRVAHRNAQRARRRAEEARRNA